MKIFGKSAGAIVLITCSILLAVTSTVKADVPEIELLIKNHLFYPSTLEVPADQKIRIRLINKDPTPEEFESLELNREKIVAGNSETIIFIGPLAPGIYTFFGEFFPKTAQGVIVAN